FYSCAVEPAYLSAYLALVGHVQYLAYQYVVHVQPPEYVGYPVTRQSLLLEQVDKLHYVYVPVLLLQVAEDLIYAVLAQAVGCKDPPELEPANGKCTRIGHLHQRMILSS